ncbi:helix-turn-helix domain-containing protein [Caballeronia sp. DA-9]|uniref:helix-turn-helix domain-containing protein n=1 Tax=Caballeronia sp. DA-9 TaxID=3436237 RepID=UPI003F673C58
MSKALSLQALASQSGVSVGMISQIERDLTSPSLRTVGLLRTALGVSMTRLLEGSVTVHGEPAAKFERVRRASQRLRFEVSEGGLTKELLSPPGDYQLQFMLVHFPPHSASVDVLVGIGEKAGLVMNGSVMLMVDGQEENLDAGDSFQFDSRLPHQVANRSTEQATVLWIMDVEHDVQRT